MKGKEQNGELVSEESDWSDEIPIKPPTPSKPSTLITPKITDMKMDNKDDDEDIEIINLISRINDEMEEWDREKESINNRIMEMDRNNRDLEEKIKSFDSNKSSIFDIKIL